MTQYNISDVTSQFRNDMLNAGVIPFQLVNIITDSPNPIRFRLSDDKPGKRNGAYILSFAGGIPHGFFMDWKRHPKGIGWVYKRASKYTAEEFNKFKEVTKQIDDREAKKKKKRMISAEYMYNKYNPASSKNPYIIKKGIKVHKGIKEDSYGNLVIPMFNGKIFQTFQTIYSSGEKRPVKGTSVKEAYFPIGEHRGIILFCEGMATGASIHEATGYAVRCILGGCGCLPGAAKKLRERYPTSKFFFCSDFDEYHKGEEKSEEAAKATNGIVIKPVFLEPRDPKTQKDFNDMARCYGLEKVKEVINNAICPVLLRETKGIIPKKVEWLYEPANLAKGMFHIIAGAPGVGKSTIVISYISKLSNGEWGEKQESLIWSSEDSVEYVIIPKIIAAGGDRNFIKVIEGTKEGDKIVNFDPSKDLPKLRETLKFYPKIKLLVIDSIADIVSGDSYKNSEVRRDLKPLVEMGMDLGIAIIGIAHTNKSTNNTKGDTSYSDKISGSIAFKAYARLVSVVIKDPIKGKNVLLLDKANLPTSRVNSGIYFETVKATIEGEIDTLKTEWGEIVERDIIDINCDPITEHNSLASRLDAKAIISRCMDNGITDGKQIEAEIEKYGISKRTMERAKKELGITSVKQRNGGMFTSGEWVRETTTINCEKEYKEWARLKKETLSKLPEKIAGIPTNKILMFCTTTDQLKELEDHKKILKFADKLVSEGQLQL